MKRIVLSLAAAALTMGLGAAVRADDTPATSSQSTAPATESAPAKPAVHHRMAHHHMMSIDLNSASKEDLMKLPGVDDATADKIIAARPFKTRAELTSKSIVTKAEYTKIRSKITVKKTT